MFDVLSVDMSLTMCGLCLELDAQERCGPVMRDTQPPRQPVDISSFQCGAIQSR